VRYKSEAKVMNPGTVPVSMTITMDLEDWKRLRSQLSHAFPAWELREDIDRLVERISVNLEATEGRGE